MSTRLRLAAFAGLLAIVFAAASVAGGAIDPGVEESKGHEEDGEMTATMEEHENTTSENASKAGAGHGGDSHAGGSEGAEAALPGLAVSAGDYRLIPAETSFQAGRAEVAFSIVGAGNEVVRDFDVEHERRMHLIIVRRDFTGFQHLHPVQDDDGSWSAEADLAAGGTYRMFADFATSGRSLTLAADLFVAGEFSPEPLPHAADTADAGDGYEVRLSDDDGMARFEVSRNGRPLDGVEPYLGADGHLVALREHDQAFLHTHPEGKPGGPGPISFGVEYPSAGRYRLYLQFKHGGKVRTAEFTQEAGKVSAGQASSHAHTEGAANAGH